MNFEISNAIYAVAALTLLLASARPANANACKTLYDADMRAARTAAVADVNGLADMLYGDRKKACDHARAFAEHLGQQRDRRKKLEQICGKRITQKCNSACWEKQYKKAAKSAGEACAPPKPRVVLPLTDMEKCNGFDAQAMESCGRVIKAGKESRENISQAYFNRANSNEISNSGSDSVIADYDKAIEFSPGQYNLYSARGAQYEHRKNYARAIADFTKSMTLKDDAQIRSMRARAYFAWGKTIEAFAQMNETIRLYGSDFFELAPLLEMRGDMFRDLHRKAEALADYQHYLALGPKFEKAGMKSQFDMMASAMKGKIEWTQQH